MIKSSSQKDGDWESCERLNNVLEAGSFGMWDLDLVTGRFWGSPRHDQIFGYSDLEPQWTFELFLDHLVPEARDEARRIITRAVEEHGSWDFECRIRRIDGGEVRWIRTQGKTKIGKQDGHPHLTGLVEDITGRKVTEEKLRESRRLLQSLFDNATSAIYFKDRQGRFTYVNRRTEEKLLRSRQELLGRTAADIWPSEMADWITAIEARVLETGEPVEDEELLKIDGKGTWFLTSRFPILDAAGSIIGVGVTATDITSRKEAEKGIREIEERFRIMADSSPLMIWITDPEGLIQFGNRSYLEFFGTTMEQATGTNWLRFVHPDDTEPYVNTFLRAIKEKKPFHAQARLRRADGQWRWIESFGNPRFSSSGEYLGYVGSSPDVTERNYAEEELRRHRLHLEHLVRERTAELEAKGMKLREEVSERKRAEEVIRRSEEQYRLVVENSIEGILIVQDGVVRFSNPRFLQITGYSTEELSAKPVAEMIHPDDRAMVLARHEGRLRGEELPGHYAFRVIDREGQTRWAEVNVVVISWEGRPATLNFLIDITQRVKAEEEKKKVEAQLAQAQKIEALGTFAGGIAHDLNNILYPIIINIELLLSEIEPGTEFHETLTQVLNAAYRQRDLVKQILSFSRRHEQRVIPVELTPLLKETLTLLRSSLPSTIEVRSRIDAGHDTVKGDPTQIQQVIMNLCRNAADSMQDQKGIIEVALTNIRLEPAQAGQGIKPGDYLALSVRDNGRGIPPETLDRLFEPFFTTKEVGKGIGMGLPVAHGIVKNHGGMITVESEPGKGSLFTVFLPVSKEKGEEIAPPADKGIHGKGKILLVDDEQFILSSMQRVLKRLGYSVKAVENGREALDAFGREPGEFDLVITDLTMPGMEGRDLIRKLKSIRQDIPVILSTGYGDTVDERDIKLMGVNELLMKPAGTSELKRAVSRAIGKE